MPLLLVFSRFKKVSTYLAAEMVPLAVRELDLACIPRPVLRKSPHPQVFGRASFGLAEALSEDSNIQDTTAHKRTLAKALALRPVVASPR